jgi:RNA polymerase sigma factor for flagellar operon FliA
MSLPAENEEAGLEGPASTEEPELWARFLREADTEARGRLIDRYIPFARILAAKLYTSRRVRETEFEDYLHYAIIGMIEAVDRFDPSRNVLFRTFAAHRIQGSILNNVEQLSERDEQLALKARLRKQRVDALREGGEEGARASPLFEQMAEVAVGLALGYMLEGSGMYVGPEDSRNDDVYSGQELKQLRATVQAIVEILPEREKDVIKYHYFHALGVEEIGNILGLTKGRISQIHRQALRNLRELYAKVTELNLRL